MFNTRLASFVTSLATLSVLASGCFMPSRSTGEDPTDAPSFASGDVLTDVAEFRAAYVAASCDWSTRCCQTMDFERAFGIVPTDEESCQEVFGLDMDATIERVEPALRGGGALFSRESAVACVAHLRALPCGADPESLGRAGPCRDVFRGARLPGEPCAATVECESVEGVHICRENLCVIIFEPTGPAGTACRDGYDCDDGTHCFEGRCRTAAPVGAACGAEMLPCAGMPCRDGVCPAPRRDGASCGRAVECASGFCSRADVCEAPRCIGNE